VTRPRHPTQMRLLALPQPGAGARHYSLASNSLSPLRAFQPPSSVQVPPPPNPPKRPLPNRRAPSRPLQTPSQPLPGPLPTTMTRSSLVRDMNGTGRYAPTPKHHPFQFYRRGGGRGEGERSRRPPVRPPIPPYSPSFSLSLSLSLFLFRPFPLPAAVSVSETPPCCRPSSPKIPISSLRQGGRGANGAADSNATSSPVSLNPPLSPSLSLPSLSDLLPRTTAPAVLSTLQ